MLQTPCPGLEHDLGMHHAGVLGLPHDAYHEVEYETAPLIITLEASSDACMHFWMCGGDVH